MPLNIHYADLIKFRENQFIQHSNSNACQVLAVGSSETHTLNCN